MVQRRWYFFYYAKVIIYSNLCRKIRCCLLCGSTEAGETTQAWMQILVFVSITPQGYLSLLQCKHLVLNLNICTANAAFIEVMF